MSTFEYPRVGKWNLEGSALFGLFRLGDSRQPFWTQAAPAKVVKPFGAGDFNKSWPAWKKHLAGRSEPHLVAPIAGAPLADALLWGEANKIDQAELRAVLALLNEPQDHTQAREAVNRLPEYTAQSLDDSASLVWVASAYALPRLPLILACDAWWRALGGLVQLAHDAAAIDLSARPLLHQRLAGELPLALGCLFPEIAPCAELLPVARRSLSVGFEELLDGEGTPHFRYIALQQSLLACWTRAKSLASASGQSCWNDEAETQFPHAVLQALRLARRDGSSLFSFTNADLHDRQATARFFAAAVRLSGDPQNDSALRRLKLPGPRGNSAAPTARLPRAANRSEWAQVALLRPNWKRSCPRLGVAYGDQAMRGELVIGRDSIFSGDWQFTCLVDDRTASVTSDWEELCWVSDRDVDYLELEIELSGGVRVQRQICLARKDQFLFLADAILAREPCSLSYMLRLPFAAGVEATAACETREIVIAGRKSRGMVFPLALPEWRVDPRGGDLAASSDSLELRQTGHGLGLYAPLWFDLRPRRQKKAFTWRQLTVAEDRQIVSRDSAAGYRIQFGGQQWLVYRSLGPAKNRTILGHNLSSEFLIARFERDGTVNALIEVE